MIQQTNSSSSTRHVSSDPWIPDGHASCVAVETIGHYSRDIQFTPITISQHELPLLEYYRENLPLDVANDAFKDDEPLENNMESLLSHLHNNQHFLEDKDVVTFRQVLKLVAASGKALKVHAFRLHGVIFVVWSPEFIGTRAYAWYEIIMGLGSRFAEILTSHKPKGTYHKGVFKATVQIGDQLLTVCYSGEVDGRNSKGDHSEIKTTTLSFYKFLERRGSEHYWQCRLGNVKQFVVGRLNEDKKCADLIKDWTPTMFLTHTFHNATISVKQGERRLQRFLFDLQIHLKNDGDKVVLERSEERGDGNDEWNVEEWKRVRSEQVSASFRCFLELKKLSILVGGGTKKETGGGGGEKKSKTKTTKKKANLSVSKSQTSTDQKETVKEQVQKTQATVDEPPKEQKKKEPAAAAAAGKKKKDFKVDATQEDGKDGPSGMDVLVKDDKKPVKMDDGYEDFGPGAQ
ncbi:unnamed protein product [Caenorhabditis sp. 36 PRJEB53466]|nr:unnamed protein product [Caenorhabditis sp. 36 PRJEB53466]